MIAACPACDSTQVYTRCGDASDTARGGDPDAEYTCQHCGERFDEPHHRPRTSATSPNAGSLAAALEQADPEEVGL